MDLNFYEIKSNQTLKNFIKEFEEAKKANIKIAIKLSKKKKTRGNYYTRRFKNN